MYATIDSTTALALARQHHSDVMASFPRKRRNRDVDVRTSTVVSLPTRMDVGAMSIPAPRESHEERTVA